MKDYIKDLREQGLTFKEIGVMLGKSPQRVHQILTGSATYARRKEYYKTYYKNYRKIHYIKKNANTITSN